MTQSRTNFVTLIGTEAHLVEVEADIRDGLPAMIIVGLPDRELRRSRELARSAIQWSAGTSSHG